MIYLDYASTTPVDVRVKGKMFEYLDVHGTFGNPASYSHSFGHAAALAVDLAREQVAELLHADPREIIWTSGATEANNLAIKGVANFHAARGRHIVTSAIEHKSVLDSCEYLSKNGYDVTFVTPNTDGIITPETVEKHIRDDTILVSLMHVNNELGTITDIDAISNITRKKNILLHVDASQSAARLPIDVQTVGVDLISMSAHKMYGPKGVGALYVRRRPHVDLEPQIHGGGHERGLRSGTIPTHQVVGMGEAARIISNSLDADFAKQKTLSDALLEGLEKIDGVFINGARTQCVPGIINIGFDHVQSESLLLALKGIALSTGSACTSADIKPSHVLSALGVSEDRISSSVRLSLGRFTTPQEIKYIIDRISHAVGELRQLTIT